MTILIAGLVIFLGVHSVAIAAPGWRDAMAARLGQSQWKALYAVVALIGLALIVLGFGAARYSTPILYVPPVWLRHVSVGLMVFVFPMLMAAYLPGRIQAKLRHPMLAAVKLWAAAHLLANGSLADVLLFGSFLVWAVAERISLKRRPARPVPGAPPSAWNDAIAVLTGLALYFVFLMGVHAWLFGVSPLI